MSTPADIERDSERHPADEAAAKKCDKLKEPRSTKLLKKIGYKFYRIFLLHEACSALVAFLFMLFERPGNTDLDYFRSVYWAFTTLFTVGYGDIVPKTVGGILTFIVALHIWGFLILPLAISNIVNRFLPNPDRFRHLEQLWLFLSVKWIMQALIAIALSKGIRLSAPPDPKAYAIDLDNPNVDGDD